MKTILTLIIILGLTSCSYYQDGSANNSVNITPQYNYGGYSYGGYYPYNYYGYYPYNYYGYYGSYYPYYRGWRY
jgi:hypothetical protein